MTFDPTYGVREGVTLLTLLCFRYWTIIPHHGENLFDIIALGKCEVPYTKSQYRFSTIII